LVYQSVFDGYHDGGSGFGDGTDLTGGREKRDDD